MIQNRQHVQQNRKAQWGPRLRESRYAPWGAVTAASRNLLAALCRELRHPATTYPFEDNPIQGTSLQTSWMKWQSTSIYLVCLWNTDFNNVKSWMTVTNNLIALEWCTPKLIFKPSNHINTISDNDHKMMLNLRQKHGNNRDLLFRLYRNRNAPRKWSTL